MNIIDKNVNEEEIIKTAKDYIEGWYNGDKQRMKNALHQNMIKRRLKDGELKELTTEQMIFGAERGGGKHVPKEKYKISVEILHATDNIASVMTKSEYIDYLHMAKTNDKWFIVNVLWEFNI